MKGMNIMDKVQDIVDILHMYNQEHIVNWLNKLDEVKQRELIEQINNIDFHQMMELYDNTKKEIELKDNKIEAVTYIDKEKLPEYEKERLEELGENVIKENAYAVVTMAGGQGTRLEHNGPKGTFRLDVYGKGKYLFEILAENLKEANERYQTTIPYNDK